MPFFIDSEGKIQTIKKTSQNILEAIEKEKLIFVDLHFTDVPGKLQHTTVPARTIDATSFETGIPKLDGSSIRGFTSISESDMILKPDPSTFVVIPWSNEDHKYGRVFCDVFWGFGQGRLSRDPRGVAQRAETHLKSSGFDVSYWGPELEFFVFDNVTWDTSTPYKSQGYRIESEEAAWAPTGTSYPIRFKEGYFPAPPQDTLMDLRNEVVKLLEQNFGILCDAHHHEVSTAGQGEINMRYDSLTNMADNVQTFKYVLKNVAHQKGKVATFMPKPIFMDNASGMHVHQSLWRDGKNTFYDPDDKHAELSQIGRYYGGGLMEHSRALTCIIAPTTNSYKRLVPGFEAPVYIAWSRRNRSANVRVPVYEKGSASSAAKRLEFRCPDPAANPYLAFPAMLAAGLDGIKKKVDIGNPVDENIYLLSPERRRELGIKELPKDLGEAADELESDQEFLKPLLGSDVIEIMIENARAQHLEVSMRPHPHEFYMYFDV
ncbi:MAG: type I glutamate--ammonia ligase [Nitrososphaerales archaeon]